MQIGEIVTFGKIHENVECGKDQIITACNSVILILVLTSKLFLFNYPG